MNARVRLCKETEPECWRRSVDLMSEGPGAEPKWDCVSFAAERLSTRHGDVVSVTLVARNLSKEILPTTSAAVALPQVMRKGQEHPLTAVLDFGPLDPGEVGEFRFHLTVGQHR